MDEIRIAITTPYLCIELQEDVLELEREREREGEEGCDGKSRDVRQKISNKSKNRICYATQNIARSRSSSFERIMFLCDEFPHDDSKDVNENEEENDKSTSNTSVDVSM